MLTEKDPLTDEGKFWVLLRYHVDTTLKQDQLRCYTTAFDKAKQLKLNSLNILPEILKEILGRVHSAKFFSVVANQTTDVSHKSQKSIAL